MTKGKCEHEDRKTEGEGDRDDLRVRSPEGDGSVNGAATGDIDKNGRAKKLRKGRAEQAPNRVRSRDPAKRSTVR